jgi:hypothetical protein
VLTKLKNFAINKVLRHVADDPKLNRATNLLALVPVVLLAALNGGADWILLSQCCDKAGSLAEVVRVVGLVVVAVLLWFSGKSPWLKQWLPTVEDIIQEVEREIQASPPGAVVVKK